MPSTFISFEGIDNCGKTTQIKKLKEYLEKNNHKVFVAREPGSTAVGGALRRILKYPKETFEALNKTFKEHQDFELLPIDQKRTGESEMFMFLASRAEFMEHIVNPHLEKGYVVIADRLADSTRAYQGGGRFKGDKKFIDFINKANDVALKEVWPNKTFLLDISYETMLKRMKNNKPDFIESLGKDFFKRTIEEYHKIAKEDPKRFIKINGEKSADDIFNNNILPIIKKLLK